MESCPYLSSLKAQDPELFKVLEENDQYDQELLKDSDEDVAENDGLDPVQKLPDNLEVVLDDSDYDEDDNDQKKKENKANEQAEDPSKEV